MRSPYVDPHTIATATPVPGGWSLRCSCGWESGPSATAEAAGLALDEHLLERRGAAEQRV